MDFDGRQVAPIGAWSRETGYVPRETSGVERGFFGHELRFGYPLYRLGSARMLRYPWPVWGVRARLILIYLPVAGVSGCCLFLYTAPNARVAWLPDCLVAWGKYYRAGTTGRQYRRDRVPPGANTGRQHRAAMGVFARLGDGMGYEIAIPSYRREADQTTTEATTP